MPAPKTVRELLKHYKIKSDGSFTLDLAKCAKSETFKSRIRSMQGNACSLKSDRATTQPKLSASLPESNETQPC